MAALTSGSWTIEYRTGDRKSSTSILNNKRMVRLKLTLTTGECPAGGFPMPGAGSVGMVRYLDGYTFDQDVSATTLTSALGRAIKWIYNTSGNSVAAWKYNVASSTVAAASGGRGLRAVATTVSITGAKIFYVTAHGW